jgi:hypothetical protein
LFTKNVRDDVGAKYKKIYHNGTSNVMVSSYHGVSYGSGSRSRSGSDWNGSNGGYGKELGAEPLTIQCKRELASKFYMKGYWSHALLFGTRSMVESW